MVDITRAKMIAHTAPVPVTFKDGISQKIIPESPVHFRALNGNVKILIDNMTQSDDPLKAVVRHSSFYGIERGPHAATDDTSGCKRRRRHSLDRVSSVPFSP